MHLRLLNCEFIIDAIRRFNFCKQFIRTQNSCDLYLHRVAERNKTYSGESLRLEAAGYFWFKFSLIAFRAYPWYNKLILIALINIAMSSHLVYYNQKQFFCSLIVTMAHTIMLAIMVTGFVNRMPDVQEGIFA